jgi:hypothetical protein
VLGAGVGAGVGGIVGGGAEVPLVASSTPMMPTTTPARSSNIMSSTKFRLYHGLLTSSSSGTYSTLATTVSRRMRSITSFSKSSFETAIAVTVSSSACTAGDVGGSDCSIAASVKKSESALLPPIPATATAPGAVVAAAAPGAVLVLAFPDGLTTGTE